jgi:transposase
VRFKPHLRKAPARLAGLRTAEGTSLPANIIEEFRRDMARLALDTAPHAMVRLLARVIGIGIETADMLVREIFSRKLRDRRAVARYAGLTGSPDESGLKLPDVPERQRAGITCGPRGRAAHAKRR